jgi:hypothetical protein
LWAGIEVLLFGVAYVVVWAIRTFVRDGRDTS